VKLLLKPGIKPGKAKKRKFVCTGGPFDKAELYLESGSTMHLNVKGLQGRYVKHGVSTLIWETK
jgi:hypothetical protein